MECKQMVDFDTEYRGSIGFGIELMTEIFQYKFVRFHTYFYR